MSKEELKKLARMLVRKYASEELSNGFKPDGLHSYTDSDGHLLYFKIRLKHPDGSKWIRPFHFDTNINNWVKREPSFPNGKPLYDLPNIIKNPGSLVIIVEGEKCVEMAKKLGFVATTSGSWTSAAGVDWGPVKCRDIIIWPDNSEDGLMYGVNVYKELMPLDCIIQQVDVALLNLPEGGDIIDWLAKHPEATQKDILELPLVDLVVKPDASVTNIIQITSADPLPECVAPPKFPLDALGTILGAAAKQLAYHVQTPLGMAGQSVLAASSLIAQNHINVKRGSIGEGPVSLFCLTVAGSGDRKSSLDRLALDPIRAYERYRINENPEQANRYIAELEAWNIKKDLIINPTKKQKRPMTQEEKNILTYELFELERTKPKMPLRPNVTFSEPGAARK